MLYFSYGFGNIVCVDDSLGKTVRGERKATHSIKPIGNTRVFLFKYRPLGMCWQCVYQISRKENWRSRIDILKARGLVPREIPDLSMYEVIDLTGPDDIADTIIPGLGREDEVKVRHYTFQIVSIKWVGLRNITGCRPKLRCTRSRNGQNIWWRLICWHRIDRNFPSEDRAVDRIQAGSADESRGYIRLKMGADANKTRSERSMQTRN